MNGNGGITTNTKISIGILISIIGATVWIISSINNVNNGINLRMDKIETRMNNIESFKEQFKPTWTDADMFRWAVHLQRENPTLKVPEPEMHTH